MVKVREILVNLKGPRDNGQGPRDLGQKRSERSVATVQRLQPKLDQLTKNLVRLFLMMTLYNLSH